MSLQSLEAKRVASFASIVVPIAAALGASAMLLVDYVRTVGVFCDEHGGCGALKQTAFARPFGVPLPAIGLAGFVLLAVLSLRDGPQVRRALVALSAAGAAVAAFLIVTQFRLATFCPFCLVVDVSAILVAIAAGLRLLHGFDPPGHWKVRAPVAVAFGLAIGLPVLIAGRAPTVPEPIARELARTPPGVVTVVDFADFECPHCRATHVELEPLLAAREGKVRLVRKHVPLPSIHPHALDAARAACCAELQGRGDVMANALFSAPVVELTPEGCERIAARLGMDAATFRNCMKDPAIDARIDADREAFRASKGRGLPTIWIGEREVVGAVGREKLEKFLDEAIAHAGS